MTWFAFQGYNSGTPIDIAGSQEKEAVFFGFHGYGTPAEAKANPNSVNFLQKAFVNAIVADFHAAQSQGSQPGGPNASILNPANAAKAALQGGIGDVWNGLHLESLFLRGGEMLAGAILLYVGIKAIATPAGQAPVRRTLRQTGKKLLGR